MSVRFERGFILELRKWQSLCVETEERWLIPSPVTGRPYHVDSIRADYPVPIGIQLGLAGIGFHTFTHTTVLGWTKPENRWAFSKSSCDAYPALRTFPVAAQSLTGSRTDCLRVLPRVWCL